MTEDYKPRFEECACGRKTTPAHCRACGSTSKYVRGKETKRVNIPAHRDRQDGLTQTDPRTILVKRYVCRYCGHAYFEDEECEAPKFAKSPSREEVMAAKAAARRGGSFSGDLARQIEMLRKKYRPTGLAQPSAADKSIADKSAVLIDSNSPIRRSAPLDEQELPPELFDSPELSQEEQEEFEKWQKGE